MPLHQTLVLFLIGLAAAASAKNVRADLKRPAFWLILLTVAVTMSAATAFVAQTRHSGTGFTTNHGWPKPFYFRYLSEVGEQSRDLDPLYFTGNSLFLAGVLLIIWAAVSVTRR